MINLHDLGVKFTSKAHNERIRHAQMLCNFTPIIANFMVSLSERGMTKLHKEGSLGSFDNELYDTCESCLLGKMTKLPFKGKGERANGPLDLIHSDVCGPMSTHAKGGFVYFITFIDDHSRYG